MAFENPILVISRPCAIDLSTSQYLIVTSTAGLAVLAADNSAGLGVLQNKPDGSASGDEVTTAAVMVYGVSRVRAGAAIAEMAPVNANAAGKAETATTGQGATGIALEAAGADNDVIAILLTPGGQAV